MLRNQVDKMIKNNLKIFKMNLLKTISKHKILKMK